MLRRIVLWALIGSAGSAAHAENLQISEYSSTKPAQAIRTCVMSTLESQAAQSRGSRPSIDALVASPRNDGWKVTFRHRRDTASVIILSLAGQGSRVLYPTQIAVSDPRLAQIIEDCG